MKNKCTYFRHLTFSHDMNTTFNKPLKTHLEKNYLFKFNLYLPEFSSNDLELSTKLCVVRESRLNSWMLSCLNISDSSSCVSIKKKEKNDCKESSIAEY